MTQNKNLAATAAIHAEGVADNDSFLSKQEMDAIIDDYRLSGDDALFARLYRATERYVAAIVRTYLSPTQRIPETIDDTCQLVWLSIEVALRRSYKLGQPGGFTAYARTIAINTCKRVNVHEFRRGSLRSTLDDWQWDSVPDQRPNARDAAAQSQRFDRLNQAIATLPATHQQVIRFVLGHCRAGGGNQAMGPARSRRLSRDRIAAIIEAELGVCLEPAMVSEIKAEAIARLRQLLANPARNSR